MPAPAGRCPPVCAAASAAAGECRENGCRVRGAEPGRGLCLGSRVRDFGCWGLVSSCRRLDTPSPVPSIRDLGPSTGRRIGWMPGAGTPELRRPRGLARPGSRMTGPGDGVSTSGHAVTGAEDPKSGTMPSTGRPEQTPRPDHGPCRIRDQTGLRTRDQAGTGVRARQALGVMPVRRRKARLKPSSEL